MKSKGFKIIVGVLVAIIVVLGGLVAFKTFAPAEQPTEYTSTGKPIPKGAMEDPALSSPSPDDDGTYAPIDGNVA